MTKDEIRKVLQLFDEFQQDYNERIKEQHKSGKGSDLVIELADAVLTQGAEAARKIVIDRAVEFIHNKIN